jgi:uncharacterized SAM-dependent methyltransferase
MSLLPRSERIQRIDFHPAGVTAAFNLNLLHRMNRELGAGFDPCRFTHEAFYYEEAGRIEMHLPSHGEQQVHLGAFPFDDGETIHTESSAISASCWKERASN